MGLWRPWLVVEGEINFGGLQYLLEVFTYIGYVNVGHVHFIDRVDPSTTESALKCKPDWPIGNPSRSMWKAVKVTDVVPSSHENWQADWPK